MPTSKTWTNGGRMRDLREARGLTQAEVATIAEATQPAVAQWERNDVRPTWWHVARIASHYGLPIAEAFPGFKMNAREKRIVKDLKSAQSL